MCSVLYLTEAGRWYGEKIKRGCAFWMSDSKLLAANWGHKPLHALLIICSLFRREIGILPTSILGILKHLCVFRSQVSSDPTINCQLLIVLRLWIPVFSGWHTPIGNCSHPLKRVFLSEEPGLMPMHLHYRWKWSHVTTTAKQRGTQRNRSLRSCLHLTLTHDFHYQNTKNLLKRRV